MSAPFESYLELSKKIARNAGTITMAGLKEDFSVEHKGKRDLVTEIDKKTERYIVQQLQEAFPDHAIMGEEGNNKDHESPWRWIIDPIDGTTNFVHGHPFFCISIGLEFEGELVVGSVFAPMFNELFSAAKGLGAYLNDTKISVSPRTALDESLLSTGFNPSFPEKEKQNIEHYKHFMNKSIGIRRCGSAALDLCYVAAGRVDGFWELALKPWDMAAGAVIVREAGGQVTAINGSLFNVHDISILATNGHIHKDMADYFAQQ